MNDKIGEALRFDAFGVAEDLTGESYKTDKGTSAIGMGLFFENNRQKEDLLRGSDDSFFNMDFVGQMAVFGKLGFEPVWHEEFDGSHTYPDFYSILWHPDGLLATCESYGIGSRNSAKVYYNYKHPDVYFDWKLKSSGRYVGDVWVGDHDAREGVRYNLDAMRAEGEFLSVWVERPWLSLVNYAEGRAEGQTMEERKAITERKISELPEHVRRAITPGV